MPVPPPSRDIEDSLLGLVAILEHAVAEARRVIADVKGDDPSSDCGPNVKAGPSDVN